MSVTYRISPEEGVVYLTAEGAASVEELEGALIAALADPAYRPGLDFISYRTRQTNAPTPTEARRFVRFLEACSPAMGGFRWAMVSPSPCVYGMQRMFSSLAEQRGIRAEAFKDCEEARRWLQAFTPHKKARDVS